jgi:hypothetical protein
MPLVDITYTSGSGTPFVTVNEEVQIYYPDYDEFYFGPVTVITGTSTSGTLRVDFGSVPDPLSALEAQTIEYPVGSWTATTVTATAVAPSGSTGTLAVTLAASTLAASGTTTVTGTLAATLADSTLAASGTTTVTGTLAVTLADSTLAASGDVESGSTGTLAVTLDSSTLAAAGDTTVTGTLAVTLDASTLAAAGDTGALPAADTTASTGSNWARMISTEPPRGIDDELEAVLASLLLLT